ncbi:NIPSNAP family protein [Clostridium estertheticum]|uniref:NIPSNAP family protein n=1 Tax=Clostridium estertheticum TaxID=238834 RepID=UPI0013E94DCD|nr:NIPSNAP family protein [Clostridium estertheticum]MBZ9686817.1 NIPSNAP family protein [Clostridium estertheticum]
MIYELRIYHINPGKMKDIHNRFSTLTLDLFKKHGMNTLDFWEDAEGKNVIYYVLEHKDMETRNQSFMDFKNDYEWMEGKRLSELNGSIVEKIEIIFMNRVPYSPATQRI